MCDTNACDKSNTMPKMKNCAEYTMICLHYLAWRRALEISNEISKNSKVEKLWEETYNNE